jgi:hypothetical protein
MKLETGERRNFLGQKARRGFETMNEISEVRVLQKSDA